jgi:hypothetical protein
MLEIVILIVLGRRIAEIARGKGRSGGPYVILLLAMWFGGEFSGILVGVVIAALMSGAEEANFLAVWALGLVGAIVGAVGAFQIVKRLPEREEPWPDEEPWSPGDGVRRAPRPAPPEDEDRIRPADEGRFTRRPPEG